MNDIQLQNEQSALQTNTSPIIASSCMYVNPLVAVALGTLLLGEPVTRSTVLATAVILASVGLSFWFDYRRRARTLDS